MLHRIKKFIPHSWLQGYHFLMANGAALYYRYPSNKIRVIGVTGTNGKSSTVQMIGHLLMELGETVGWTTTASFRIADREVINSQKMTMLGRTQTHKMMGEMVKRKCKYAIIETSSQGILQYRHIGINYDTVLFTNLTPEHIEAHGGFDNYKATKLRLFQKITSLKKKRLDGELVPKKIIVNLNDQYSSEFARFNVDQVIGYADDDREIYDVHVDKKIVAEKPHLSLAGTAAKIGDEHLKIGLIGPYYLENAMAAISTVVSLGFPMRDVLKAGLKLEAVPGRLETFSKDGVTVIVDYAPEPFALEALYKAVALFSAKRIIHVTGSTGGGRDTARRKVIGQMSAAKDDVVIVTNEDPYDEEPMSIIDEIADAAKAYGKVDGEDLFRILDRKEAIEKAISLAGHGDVVLVTGKGSEPVMAISGGRKVPSDDRVFVRDILGI
ncbi:MAG TPA: UDP-N-acetylmuramyl-tripeptide synthetase [Patescibacteria group bacterium]|nr:UDP-N-acetylmuramyl-tripeptide synthetase [Patescibacteria group bacterium]